MQLSKWMLHIQLFMIFFQCRNTFFTWYNAISLVYQVYWGTFPNLLTDLFIFLLVATGTQCRCLQMYALVTLSTISIITSQGRLQITDSIETANPFPRVCLGFLTTKTISSFHERTCINICIMRYKSVIFSFFFISFRGSVELDSSLRFASFPLGYAAASPLLHGCSRQPLARRSLMSKVSGPSIANFQSPCCQNKRIPLKSRQGFFCTPIAPASTHVKGQTLPKPFNEAETTARLSSTECNPHARHLASCLCWSSCP